MTIFRSEPGLAGCRLNAPSPLIPELHSNNNNNNSNKSLVSYGSKYDDMEKTRN